MQVGAGHRPQRVSAGWHRDVAGEALPRRQVPLLASRSRPLTGPYATVFTEAHFTGAFTQTDPLPESKNGALAVENGHAVGKEAKADADEGINGVQAPVVPIPVVSKKKRSKADVSGAESPTGSLTRGPSAQRLSLHQVAHSIPAMLLIDDSIENALDCATASPPVSVLLFGAYPWNRHVSRQETPEDMLAHAERVARGIDSEAGEQLGEEIARAWTGESEGQELPACVRRVRGWEDVVQVLGGVVKEARAAAEKRA